MYWGSEQERFQRGVVIRTVSSSNALDYSSCPEPPFPLQMREEFSLERVFKDKDDSFRVVEVGVEAEDVWVSVECEIASTSRPCSHE